MVTNPLVRVPQFGFCNSNSVGTTGDPFCSWSAAKCSSPSSFEVAGINGQLSSDAPFFIQPGTSNMPCIGSEITIGRCTSDLDDHRCAPVRMACGQGANFYEEKDDDCSLTYDKANNVPTKFPACGDKQNKFLTCALDESYCKDEEEFWYSKWVERMSSNFEWEACYCDRVPVGACVPKTTTSLTKWTPYNTACAVTADECDSTAMDFIAAREFEGHEQATYQCRLCFDAKADIPSDSAVNNNKDSSKKNLNTYLAGACQDITSMDYVACALESSDCSPNTSFVSSGKLTSEGLQCPVSETTNWGECAGDIDNVECANKSETCNIGFRFEQKDECNIYQHETSKSGLETRFPSCEPQTTAQRDWHDIRCVYDESECIQSVEHFQPARVSTDALYKDCRCSDVYTGMCKDSDDSDPYCAVSPSGCEVPGRYIFQHQLKEKGYAPNSCPLCLTQPLLTPQPSASTPHPSPQTIQAPVKQTPQPSFGTPPPSPPIFQNTVKQPTPAPSWQPTRPRPTSPTMGATTDGNQGLTPVQFFCIVIAGLIGPLLFAAPVLVSWFCGNEDEGQPHLSSQHPQHKDMLEARNESEFQSNPVAEVT